MERKLTALLKRQGAILEAAFLEAIQELRRGVNFPALIAALERGDIEGAIAALDIDVAAFTPFVQAQTAAYAAASSTVIGAIPSGPSGVAFRFNLANPRAERWIAENVASGVVGLVEDQVQIIRQTILAGYSRGEGSQKLAVDIAGRLNPATKVREGGLVGLSDPQSKFLDGYRARLASGDPADLRYILKHNTLRDKRFDRTLKAAIKNGTPLSDEMQARMARAYSDRLLKRRAEDIARTELGRAVEAARKEAFLQAAEKEGYPEAAISREWVHGGGEGPMARPDHAAMHGQIRQGTKDPFVMNDGSAKIHAMDGIGGAAQDANCRCSTRWTMDWTWGLT